MHISQGIIIAMLFLPTLGVLAFCLVVGFPFLIDLDFLLSKYAKNNNHRRLITHSLIPYIGLLVVGIYFPIVLVLGICGVVHILTDLLDWGTALFLPFYNETIGGILPKPPKEIVKISDYRKRQCWFTTTYYKSKFLLILEVLFGIAAIIMIILIDIWYLWILLFYFLFVIIQIRFSLECHNSPTVAKNKIKLD